MSFWSSLSGRQLLLTAVVTVAMSCSTTVDHLGYMRQESQPGAGAGSFVAGAGVGAGGAAAGSFADGRVATVLGPLLCPAQATYRNVYHDILGKSEGDTYDHVSQAFSKLFYGNSDSAIYFEFDTGGGQAIIKDILHGGEVRTEGMGIAMLAAVMLGRRDEFDKLWRFARAHLQYEEEPLKGYFRSFCDASADSAAAGSDTSECVDPYGFQQFVMALLLARKKFAVGDIDYEADARRLFDVLRNKEFDQRSATFAATGGTSGLSSQRGGASFGAAGSASGVAGAASLGSSSSGADIVSNLFDDDTHLVYVDPRSKRTRVTATAFLMPGYYSVWGQVTGDSYYSDAARAAREFLADVAHPVTGLIPIRATFDGKPVEHWSDFSPEAYRALINLVIEQVWGLGDGQSSSKQINNLLAFFKAKGLDTYGSSYKLDGSVLKTDHTAELVLVNGVLAAYSTISDSDKKSYVEDAWEVPVIPSNTLTRYYHGILYLLCNLILSGQFRLC